MSTQILAGIYILFWLLFALFFKINFKISGFKFLFGVFLLIALGVAAQSFPVVKSVFLGMEQVKLSLAFSHDQSWHAALIYELSNHFPPQIPGFAGQSLKNYHYFYDLLISAQYQLFGGSVALYIEVIYPVIISILFGISVFRTISLITKNYLIQITTVFLAYFANNLQYILVLLRLGQWWQSVFFLDQPLIFLFNQPAVLSIVFFFYFLIFLKQSFKNKGSIVLAGLILGLLAGLKIYAFIVGIMTLGFFTLYVFIRSFRSRSFKKCFKFVLIGLIAGIVVLIIAFNMFTFGKSFIDYNPGWIIQAFYEKMLNPYFKQTKIASYYVIYQLQGKYLKFLILQIIFGAIFVIGSLGVRIVGLLVIFKKKIKKIEILLLIASLISLLVLFIGNQSGSAYNIIQFGPYLLTASTILLGGFLAQIKKKNLLVFFIALILLLSLPVTWHELGKYNLKKDNRTYDKQLMEALDVLSTLPQGNVFNLYNFTRSSEKEHNIVGSIGRKNSYLLDLWQLEVLKVDIQKRWQFLEYIKRNDCSLKENFSTDYLLLEEGVEGRYCLGFDLSQKKLLFTNKKYKIYKAVKKL
ncbi:hypothetical protein GYA49_05320 [Candidatus Beckwithbacteria bacterium]|nr:hypothetical protein [Candidatus Beckwithbacteria bacterium]